MSNIHAAIPPRSNAFFSWPLIILLGLIVLTIGVLLEKPSGSIAGRLALQQRGFNLYSYDMHQHHVYAMAIGPRGKDSNERGVWVNEDGTFRIDRLPVGEYELKVHVPGFASSLDSGIFVEEGQVTEIRDVALDVAQPSVQIASNSRVFTSKEQPHFWLNASGANKANVRIYRSDMLSMIKNQIPKKYNFEINSDFSMYKPYYSEKKEKALDYFAKERPIKEWTRQLQTDDTDSSRQDFKLEQPLPAGDYFAVAKVSNIQSAEDWNMYSFTVTDLGLIVKQDPVRTVVRAIDLNTLKPIGGAQITLGNRIDPNKTIANATTHDDGFVSIPRATGNDYSELLVYGTVGAYHAYGGMSFYSDNTNGLQTYFYTDKSVYRLGQTVLFKGIIRGNRGEKGFTNPGANLKLPLTVEDPDNNVLWSGRVTTNDHGTFHGSFEVPADGKTGAYQVQLTYPDGGQDYERFEVAEYRKPEYLVEVSPMVARQIAGAKAKARIKASYFFGAPVANAKVKYTVYSSIDWSSRYKLMDRPAYYSYFDGWNDDAAGYDSSYSGDYISEGTAMTDENGEAVVEFDTKKPTFDPKQPYNFDRWDHRYKVEAEVTDISRLSVLGSGSMGVTNGEFALFVKPTQYIAKVGQSISADVSAVDYDGKPVANKPVNLRLFRRVYNRQQYAYVGTEDYANLTVNTDAAGKAHIDFATKPEFVTDDYGIVATAQDSRNDTIVDDTSIWVVSENSKYSLPSTEANKEPLAIKLDKDVYQPGDTARLMVTGPLTGVEGCEAIVAVEGQRLYDYKVVPMKGTAQLVEIPLTVDYAPNVFATVTLVCKKHQYYSASQMIKISPAARFLNVTVETDKPKYKPGETAVYTIKTQYADGKPAPNTEVSLGVVDESIYAIRPETAPDIRKFFYAKRGNLVVTVCSFPEDYSGGPNKDEPRMRKDFKDTAAWLPELETDKDGVAKVSVKLPDNLTTWRATVRAVSRETEVGSTIQKVIATQDLIVRIAAPRFFTQGDEGTLAAVVHNYTDVPQTVRLVLSTGKEFDVRDSLEQKLTVFPDKAQRYSWPVKVVASGTTKVTCKAYGDTANDAMQTTIPIRGLGVPSFAAQSGVIAADESTVNLPIQVPANAAPGSAQFHLYVSSSSISSIISNFGSLIDYPYGCTEQTMSKLFPSVVAMRLNQTLGVPLDPKDKKRFAEVYKQSMDKLNGYQHADGGWGWWADDESQVYLTSLVLDGYRLLQDAGYNVPQDRRTNGLNYLSEQTANSFKIMNDPLYAAKLTGADEKVDLARAVYTLTEYGKPMTAPEVAWAQKNSDKLVPEALAYFALAAKRSNNAALASQLVDRLMSLANRTQSDFGNTMDWSLTDELRKKLGLKYNFYTYRYTDTERSALILQALAETRGDDVDTMEAVKHFIMQQRGKNGWDNTKTTAQVLRSVMISEIQLRKQSGPTNFAVNINVSGVNQQVLNFDQQSTSAKEQDISLPLPAPGASSSVTLHKNGTGRLYYSGVLTYQRVIAPNEAVENLGMPKGLMVVREYFRLKPGATDANGNVHFTAEKLGDLRVKAGETILMKVHVTMPSDVPYMCVEAPLPSGAEAVENDSRANATEDNQNRYEWEQWWWSHQDILDDHLAFFVDNWSAGKAELHQMIRMEIPGKFQVAPVTLEGMYTNGVRGYSRPDVITVTE